MPRYFFSLQNGGTLPDQEGEILADDQTARETALEVFAETLAGKTTHLCDGGVYQVVVSREKEGPMFSITAQGRHL